jgi:methylenetetrahydrofolate--tRNA-(uracil-5-)-methyltransferase
VIFTFDASFMPWFFRRIFPSGTIPFWIKKVKNSDLNIIGGGLAGCEAAWQAAEAGLHVKLFEMRPLVSTGAHKTDALAELVCSNSLGSLLADRASGLLKEELKVLKSLLVECAEKTALPAGNALAVDRTLFSQLVTEKILDHPRIEIIRSEVKDIPTTPAIISSGPLTSSDLAQSIKAFLGHDSLFFFDAIAPIVSSDSINFNIAFKASRFHEDSSGEGDYINCPFSKDEYLAFVETLKSAQTIELKPFESEILSGVRAGARKFFEGCLPIEELAHRDPQALAFGPMRPIGLYDPRTGKGAYAILQLRQDNQSGSLYNMVGFQTNLTYSEQKRVFRTIPGLEKAEFIRLGQMHRNTYIESPLSLKPTLQSQKRDNLFFAGQLIGVEGYMGNIASGWLAGTNAARLSNNQPLITFPPETMLGALIQYVTSSEVSTFQPMKANFGILKELPEYIRSRKEKNKVLSNRSLKYMNSFMKV